MVLTRAQMSHGTFIEARQKSREIIYGSETIYIFFVHTLLMVKVGPHCEQHILQMQSTCEGYIEIIALFS